MSDINTVSKEADTLMSLVITLCGAFLVVLVGIVGWIGSMIFRKLDSNEKGLRDVQLSVTRIESNYTNIKENEHHREKQLMEIKELLMRKDK